MSDWWARGKEPLLQNEAEVDTEDLSDAAVTAAKIAANAVEEAKIKNAAVTTDKIAANAVEEAKIKNAAVTTDKIADDTITQVKISTASRFDGTVVRDVGNVAAAGGIPVLHRITASALTGDVDVTLTHKTRIIEVWAVKTGGAGGAGDTVQVKKAADVITNALDMSVGDNIIVRATEINDSNHEIAAAGTLRVTGASAVSCEVYILGVRTS